MEKIIDVLKILADKNRLRIINLLEQRKMCVCELAFVLGVTQPSVSRHLKKMKAVGLIGDEKDGFWTNYYLLKESEYRCGLRKCLGKWLRDDVTLAQDIKKLAEVNRTKLCCS